jgi:hypothetical protein
LPLRLYDGQMSPRCCRLTVYRPLTVAGRHGGHACRYIVKTARSLPGCVGSRQVDVDGSGVIEQEEFCELIKARHIPWS